MTEEKKVRLVFPDWLKARIALTVFHVVGGLALAWLAIFWAASLGERWDQNPATLQWVNCHPNETPAQTATAVLQYMLIVCLGFVSIVFFILSVAAANGVFEEKDE